MWRQKPNEAYGCYALERDISGLEKGGATNCGVELNESQHTYCDTIVIDQ